ncbi:hypothetical protein CCUS01_01013 [Colletotrichum cuscutae]|uniref:Uncharacterized protein n=1 Tax=Colletotrichum cuscutae TaxID=1209917 RepID=A0AAI9Y4R8_9PEZI|nr:hypothetical protein CCUS01_01013 [Colletotrichum cuscutae]
MMNIQFKKKQIENLSRPHLRSCRHAASVIRLPIVLRHVHPSTEAKCHDHPAKLLMAGRLYPRGQFIKPGNQLKLTATEPATDNSNKGRRGSARPLSDHQEQGYCLGSVQEPLSVASVVPQCQLARDTTILKRDELLPRDQL